ncbi:MAG: FAD-binding oxidoreductase [Lachnospiraceae bacterium]|nr:FAD-binding oxidoreductase [Lachnospiraceae bacterium]
MATLREDLSRIIPDPERIITDNIDRKYLSDQLGRKQGHAEALVFTISTEEVSGVLQYAYAHGIAVTPRGAGTNLVGSTVPQKGGIILDLSRMNRILELDEDTFTVTVEPGILLRDLQAFVESKGFFYPPDPGEKEASIGGNISTNAGGMRAVKYGVTRDYVRGLELVTADGTVMTVGTKNVKDTTGLPLKHLVIGAEGTLAVITKCILRLIPKPETTVSVLVSFSDLKTGIGSVIRILRANADPVAVEFMERNVVALGESYAGIKYPETPNGAKPAESYILLSFDGSSEDVAQKVERVRRLALENGALDYLPLWDPQQAAEIWAVRGALVKAVEAVSEQEPIDLVVPIDRSEEFIRFVNELSARTGMQMISFGHAGDGNVHLCVVRGDRDEETWERELDANLTELYSRTYEIGGLISGEHGLGIAKRKYFFKETAAANVAWMNRIKDALDPRHILNDRISYIR